MTVVINDETFAAFFRERHGYPLNEPLPATFVASEEEAIRIVKETFREFVDLALGEPAAGGPCA